MIKKARSNTSTTLAPFDFSLSTQKALITKVLEDPKNREYVLAALAAGLISSVAIESLYERLQHHDKTHNVDILASRAQDSLKRRHYILAGAIFGVLSGSASVLYKINKAHRASPLV